MNNYKQNTARKGKELFITNYRIEDIRGIQKQKQMSLF
jgi:hypothetical protein